MNKQLIVPQCPGELCLLEWRNGTLGHESNKLILVHVESCQKCQVILGTLPQDMLETPPSVEAVDMTHELETQPATGVGRSAKVGEVWVLKNRIETASARIAMFSAPMVLVLQVFETHAIVAPVEHGVELAASYDVPVSMGRSKLGYPVSILTSLAGAVPFDFIDRKIGVLPKKVMADCARVYRAVMKESIASLPEEAVKKANAIYGTKTPDDLAGITRGKPFKSRRDWRLEFRKEAAEALALYSMIGFAVLEENGFELPKIQPTN